MQPPTSAPSNRLLLNDGPPRPDICRGRVRPLFAVISLWFLAALAIIVSTGVLIWELRSSELARSEREIDNLSQVLAEQTARTIQGTTVILQETEERMRAGQTTRAMMDDRSIHTLLRARIGGVPQVRTLAVTDADGIVQQASANYPAPRISLADRDYFIAQRDRHETGTAYLGHPIDDRLEGGRSLPLSWRASTADGHFAGVVVAAIDPVYFERLYASLNLDAGSEVLLFMRDGTLIAGQPHRREEIGKSAAASPIFRALDADASAFLPARKGGPLHIDGPSPAFVAYREIADFPLMVAVVERQNIVLAAWRQQAMLLVTAAGAVLLVLTLGALVLGRKLISEEQLTLALHDSQLRLQGIITSAMDAIITVDETGHILLFNPAAEKMFRCPRAEALGSALDRFIPQRYRAGHGEQVRRFGATGVSSRTMGGQVDIVGCRADGEEFPADISISQVVMADHTLYTAVVRDVTQRKAAENELRQSHRQLRNLLAALESVREEERTRFARELHDELGQHMTGLKMDLAWLERRVPADQPAMATKIAGMNQLVDVAVASVRRMAAELRPSILDDLGLVAALEWLAHGFEERSGIAVDLDLAAGEAAVEGLDEGRTTALFRIVQESLTNVARHAAAKRVGIALHHADGQLLLAVADDGRGMPETPVEGHFGLIGIRERVALFGGRMRVTSRPGAGTTVEVSLPLATEATA